MFSITATGLDEAIAKFSAAGPQISSNLAAAVEQTLIEVDKQVVNTFKQGGPGWKDISAKWRRWKTQNFFSSKILIMTGMLSGSITHRKLSKHAGRVYIRPGVYPPLKRHFVAGSKIRKRMAKMIRPSRTVQQVGYWHETGSGQSAARPFFETTASWFQPHFRLLAISAIRNAIT